MIFIMIFGIKMKKSRKKKGKMKLTGREEKVNIGEGRGVLCGVCAT